MNDLRGYEYLDEIMAILGTTTPHFWPFVEKDGIVVAGLSASGDLIPSETAAAAEALEDDFNPLLLSHPFHAYHFNPVGDHHLAGNDHADLSFGDASVDSPFSMGALITPVVVSDNTIMAKYDSAGAKEEYRLFIDSSAKLSVELHDASASAKEVAVSDTALVIMRSVLVVITYDGGQAAPVLRTYIKGLLDNDGASTETGSYVAMEDLAAPLTIGCAGVTATPTTEFHGYIAMPFLTGKALSGDEVKGIHNIYRLIAGLP